MMMSIKVTKRSMVKPAEETPRRSLWLSGLDLIFEPETYVCSAFYYPHNDECDNVDNGDGSKFFNAEAMKESLSRALVPFYPLAGRLSNRRQQRLEIECNGEGALFVEAETTQYALSDFEEDGFSPNDRLLEVVMVPRCDYTEGKLSSPPLLIVQLTRFKCGGVALGFSQQHSVADGAAYLHFIISWSRLARGVGLEFPPILDRTSYLLARSPPQVSFHHLEYDQGMPSLLPGDSNTVEDATTTTTASIFKLSKDQISALKLEAASSEEVQVSKYKLSTFEVLAGQVWRSACKARGLAHDQEVKIRIPFDGRSRLGLPKGYFGNVVFYAACVAKAGDIVCKPLWYAASEIHKALKRMKEDEEYLRSAVDYLELTPGITTQFLARMPSKCAYLLSINSWARLPFNDANFGWGEPIFGGNAGIQKDCRCYIMQSQNGDDSLSVAIRLFPHQISLFTESLYDI